MAAHIEEQQELDNFKYFWKRTGRWIFAVLILAAAAYLGYTVYQNHQAEKNQEAAAVLVGLVEKAQQKADPNAINADLKNLQENYADTISAAQATLMAAATEFDAGRLDIAAGHLQWILKNQNEPLVQALAAQRLAVVYLQQKKYDDALNALNTKVESDFQPLLLETKGDVYAAQGNTAEAAKTYQQALDLLTKESVNRDLLQLKIDAQK
ncbi:tetratricopeptide repeat protein [Neisseria sp. ZJ106]|uniref:Ancillary SecYEG translocon subunit n=1 Tax=Neisseria lisongii TaxID=2912188 RepID=A0AAW5ASR6_9NEIS|nr:tetratricopeptide repeat protein [Neisseria lisongii]MCF7520715.1 tetratricopeptide repeat protein [Neisseria lisongii]MCF7530035.1 tetratricopeptide repeat protein [Neisseria lisongii]WCL72361.1 tetratricopeptide repeat protein [Neisseria lisongii]